MAVLVLYKGQLKFTVLKMYLLVLKDVVTVNHNLLRHALCLCHKQDDKKRERENSNNNGN